MINYTIGKLKKHRRLLLYASLLALVFVLSACAQRAQMEPIGPESEGLWEGIIIYNLSRIIIYLSELFGGNYGVGIILVTVIFRILMIPITNMQQKSTGKMSEIQPQLQELQEKYSAKDAETKEKLQEETQKLYDEAGVNPLKGCLPLIIQMPIFIAVYQAVSRTPQLANENFLWVSNLGEPDSYFILPILAGLFTFGHSFMLQMNQPGNSGKIMSFIMPLFIVFITLGLSAGLALHFTASNAFAVVQTLITKNPFKERREKQKEVERKEESERQRKRAIRKAQKLGRNVKKK